MLTIYPRRNRGQAVELSFRCGALWGGCRAVCGRRSGYIDLHGTGTVQNDLMEGRAVARLFPGGVPCSSTKGLVGHTLGCGGGA